MSPILPARDNLLTRRYVEDFESSWKYELPTSGYVVESWSQGYLIGALATMAFITVANMSKRLLHRLILIELLLAIPHGTFCFMDFPGYGWYVSVTAVMLYVSWCLHNIIAWMKTRPFLTPLHSKIYLISFLIVLPYWILETYGNFAFNNNINDLFKKTRPFEILFREPWWVFTCCNFVYNIKKRYQFGFLNLFRTCPRIGIMMLSMLLSIIFSVVDVLSATVKFGAVEGINPYWKLSLAFKCFCDAIILDDFRSALDRIRQVALSKNCSLGKNGGNGVQGSGGRVGGGPGPIKLPSRGDTQILSSNTIEVKSIPESSTALRSPTGDNFVKVWTDEPSKKSSIDEESGEELPWDWNMI